jgi:hypothetical protein
VLAFLWCSGSGRKWLTMKRFTVESALIRFDKSAAFRTHQHWIMNYNFCRIHKTLRVTRRWPLA